MQTQEYTYCAITSNAPIGKEYEADLRKNHLPLFSGRAENFVGTITEIGATLAGFGVHDCLTVGLARADQCLITTKARETAGEVIDGLPVLARSETNWYWPDEPGLLVFDHDPGHWTGAAMTSVAEVVSVVGKALGVDLMDYDFVAKPSASSHIYLGDDEVVGFRGAHVYVGVKSLAHVDADKLQSLAFQHGFGCGVVSKSGSLLKRTVFDSALHKAPNMPVFAGDPSFVGEHTSRRPVTVNATGLALDLQYIQGLAREELAEAAWQNIRGAAGPAVAKARDEYIVEREAMGLSRAAVEAACTGELPSDWPIIFDDNVTVKLQDIMLAGGKYHGRTDVRDPLEPEYGESKAKIFVDNGKVTIHSFAHGGRTYRCSMGLAGLAEALEGNPHLKKDWQALVGLLDSSYTPKEIVDTLTELGVDGTKVKLREEVKALKAQARADHVRAGDWGSKYAYMAEGGKFISLPTLERHQLIISIPTFSFNLMYCNITGPRGEAPASYLVNEGHIPRYERLVSIPADTLGGLKPMTPDALNIWQPGPAVTRFAAEPALWLKLARHMFPNTDERENLLDWLAYALQYPGRKCNWQVMLRSTEGMGKDSLLHPLRWGMGYHNTVDVSCDELLGSFQHYLARGPKLIVLQEIDAAHKTQMRNKLKPLAAAPPLLHMVNQKNEKPVYVSNTQAVIVLTNAIHPVSLDKGDRRWYMMEAKGAPLGGDFFKALWAWYGSGGARQVAGWLAARDLSAFDPDWLPANTEYKDIVIDLSLTGYYMAVREYIEETNATCTQLAHVVAYLRVKGSVVTSKQVQTALADMGWRAVKPNKKLNGSVISQRGWVSPSCDLTGVLLWSALQKTKLNSI